MHVAPDCDHPRGRLAVAGCCAEAALGPRFDVKAFHDLILAQGSVPLPVLEQQVRGWVAQAKAAPAAAAPPAATPAVGKG